VAERARAALALLLLAACTSVLAQEDLDARLLRLASQLRCVVCQNQTLADSHAELAVDLRRRIAEQMRAGASDEAIRNDLVQKYGDFVLYDPPLQPRTWLLWFGPLLLLAIAAIFVARSWRRDDGQDEELP
jgi:cytochrome c-type biogenesis protein CcmH